MVRASQAMSSASVEKGRLFRQDRLILSNTIRATFAGWHDRAIAALILLAALAAVHAWLADRPWRIAAWVTLAGGAFIGNGVGRVIAKRLAFHAFDGLFAADALQPLTRWRYIAAWHSVGLTLLALPLLIARPSILVPGMAAYLAGALVAGLLEGVGMPMRILGTLRAGPTLRAWSHRPITGAAAAMVLLGLAVPARVLGMNALMAVVGVETLLLTLMLTSVDDAAVRFMTAAGHGARRIVVLHARGLAAFLAVAVPGCWALLGAIAGAVVAATGAVMLTLLTLRVLAYRLHARRFADFLVSVVAGVFVLVAYLTPVALPIIVVAVLWRLQRRGRARTWLLA